MPKEVKKKLTAEQKARKKRDDAEKKLKDEEVARVKAEAEEVERKKLEKIAAEKARIIEVQECKVRRVELELLDEIWQSGRNQLRRQQSEQRKLAKWARYMKCDGSPDPTVLTEINMFLTLTREDQVRCDFQELIDGSQLVIRLINELEDLLADNLDEELTDVIRRSYSNSVNELQDLLSLRLDLASHVLLCRSSELANIDTNNLEYYISNDLLTLCMWGNISKNPRIKSYEFAEKGLYFELPKLLTLSDCAIRGLFTTFDHISRKSASFYPRVKAKESELVPEVVAGEENPAEEVIPLPPVHSEKDEKKEHNEEEEEEEEEEAEKDMKAVLKQLASEKADSKPEEEEEEEEEEETEKEQAEEVVEDWQILTPEEKEFEDFDGDDETIDLRGFHVVGGILYFNLLHMPPQPRVINSWTITQLVNPPQLQLFEYSMNTGSTNMPAEVPANEGDKRESVIPTKRDSETQPATKRESETQNHRESSSQAKRESEMPMKRESEMPVKIVQEMPPISVTLRLPENVYFCEEPQIARWDYKTNNWKTDCFMDRVYNEAGRMLTFRICEFGTLCLVQDAHINMPFQAWEIRSRDVNHAQLNIIAAIVEVEIQIKDGLVCLSQPADKAELSHLIGKWMNIHELVKIMRSSGVNVFPEEDSLKYVKICDKNRAAEDRLYQQIGLIASAMSFSWSKWNFEVNDSEKILFQGTEHLKDEPLLEEDWALFLVTKKKASKLKMTEISEEFSDERFDDMPYISNMYHLAMKILSEEGKQRVLDTSPIFTENVYQVLRSARLIPYS